MKVSKAWKYHLILGIVLLTIRVIEEIRLEDQSSYTDYQNLYFFSLHFSFCIVSIIIYLINFYYVCPKYLNKKTINKFAIGVVLLILVFAGIRFLLEEIVLFNITGIHNYSEASRNLSFYLFDNTYFALKPILYSTLLFLALKFIETNDQNKAEIDLLKSQISPHFLFNTLNAFYVELIDDKPSTAKDIHKLSELLRYVTYDSKKEFVFLHEEITFLKDYIHFFEKRFEKDFSVKFKVIGNVKNQKVPSLILIHFVENLFKHGVVNDQNNPASISINISDHFLELNTTNKILLSEKFMESGIGTKNVKKRLNTIFKSNYKLAYTTKTPYFNTYLKMPL